MEVSHSPTVGP